MAFEITPDKPGAGGGGGKSRPDVRAGKKLLWCAGITYGTSQSGNQKIDTCWVVVDDPDGGLDTGALVFDTFTLTQRAAWKLQQVAGALRCTKSFDAESKDQTWEVFSKRPVWAEINIVPKYSGEGETGKVERYSAFGDDATDKMEELVTAAEAWYEEWQARRGGGGGSRRAVRSESVVAADDDIPF